jgi:hypothetical protein
VSQINYLLANFGLAIDCPKFLEEYNLAISNNTLAAFEFNFNLSIWSELNDQFLNYYATSPNDAISINYVVGSCGYTCYEESEIGPLGQTGLTPVYLNCGTNCCKVTKNYVKVGNEFVSVGSEIYEPNEECEATDVSCIEGGSPTCTGGCDELVAF